MPEHQDVRAQAHNKPLRVLQITDCHLGEQAGDCLLGLNADESLVDVLDVLVADESSADLLLATGDISNNGANASYTRFLDLVRDKLSQPLGWLAGNHDQAKVMATIERPNLSYRHIDVANWRIILLDSSVPDAVHGEVQPAEMQRLQALLADSDKHTLVFVHHQPVPVGSAWMDQYIIRNADALLNELGQHLHVKGLIWGHVHQSFEAQHQHIELRATPSTCIQFKPLEDDFALDDVMPGYRWFDLHHDGSFQTGVTRIPRKEYPIDFGSGGY